MSLSRNSSFETIIVVNEKSRDPLQFIADPDNTSEQVDLKGLSESACKSFETLRLWQQTTGCFDHDLVHTIITNIVDQGDKYHTALKKTVANAQRGQTFADEVVVFCKALANKHDSPEARLNELLSTLIKAAKKAHRRSIKTRDELKGVRDALSEISTNMKSQVSMIEEDTLIAPDLEDDTPFNGVNTCFVTFPKRVAAVSAKVVSQSDPWNSHGWTVPNAPDTDDEDAIIDVNHMNHYDAAGWDNPTTTAVRHLSFANVADQLMGIVRDVSSFVSHFARCVDWWARMEAGLDGLKDTLPGVILDRTRRTSDLIRGWNGVADQFEIYIYRTKPFLTNYHSHVHFGRKRNVLPVSPPPKTYIPPPIPAITPPELAPVAEKPKPLWKKLAAVTRS